MPCSPTDIVCALNDFATFIWSIFWLFIQILIIGTDYLIQGLTYIWLFITAVFSLLVSIIAFLTGFLGDLFALNPTLAVIGGLIFLAINVTVIIRVYDILADVHFAGFKLPKLRK